VFKKIIKMFLWVFLILFFLLVLITAIPQAITHIYSSTRIYNAAYAPEARAAVVFGAGLQRDGRPSPVLRDRVATAADLYFAGKVEKILMSGDNRFLDYNEPGAMYDYAVELGVPPEDIVLDYAGRRTYDTCYRARVIFGLEEAILVTQKFHLSRTIFTCNGLGLKSWGVVADRRPYSSYAHNFWRIREIPATTVAVWQVWVSHPLPVLGNYEPIFLDQIIQ
jgi:SanA protein